MTCLLQKRGREEWENLGGGGPQGRLSLFLFPLSSTGLTVTRKTERKMGEEGQREAEMENNGVLTCL